MAALPTETEAQAGLVPTTRRPSVSWWNGGQQWAIFAWNIWAKWSSFMHATYEQKLCARASFFRSDCLCPVQAEDTQGHGVGWPLPCSGHFSPFPSRPFLRGPSNGQQDGALSEGVFGVCSLVCSSLMIKLVCTGCSLLQGFLTQEGSYQPVWCFLSSLDFPLNKWSGWSPPGITTQDLSSDRHHLVLLSNEPHFWSVHFVSTHNFKTSHDLITCFPVFG